MQRCTSFVALLDDLNGYPTWRPYLKNEQIQNNVGDRSLERFINTQYLKYIGQVCRAENIHKLLAYRRHPWIKTLKLLGMNSYQHISSTINIYHQRSTYIINDQHIIKERNHISPPA